MKFAKVLLVASLLVPSVASAQQQPLGNTQIGPVPTNFLPLIPFALSALALPIVLPPDNDPAISTTSTN